MKFEKQIALLRKTRDNIDKVTYTITEKEGVFLIKRGKYRVAEVYQKDVAERIVQGFENTIEASIKVIDDVIGNTEMQWNALQTDLFGNAET